MNKFADYLIDTKYFLVLIIFSVVVWFLFVDLHQKQMVNKRQLVQATKALDEAGLAIEASISVLEASKAENSMLWELQLSSKKTKEKIRWALESYISEKYHISPRASKLIVSSVIEASEKTLIPIELLVAVMAVESRFNPFAGSTADAEGLMQIILKYHKEKFEKENDILDYHQNTIAGALALKEFIQRHGDVSSGLLAYNGSLWDENLGYATKVFEEERRIRQWIKQKT